MELTQLFYDTRISTKIELTIRQYIIIASIDVTFVLLNVSLELKEPLKLVKCLIELVIKNLKVILRVCVVLRIQQKMAASDLYIKKETLFQAMLHMLVQNLVTGGLFSKKPRIDFFLRSSCRSVMFKESVPATVNWKRSCNNKHFIINQQ